MFASATLKYIEELGTNLWNDPKLVEKAHTLRTQIDNGIKVTEQEAVQCY